MILNKYGYKRTANQLAKEIVYDYGAARCIEWQDEFNETYADAPTERELHEITCAIQRQLTRVSQFLGAPNPLRDKEDE